MFNSSLLLAVPTYNPASDIALLLHMNGANSSSSFVDSSQYNHAITLTGAPTISTTQSKFGGASGYFGTSYINSTPKDQLSIATNNIFNFGSNDFTVEAFIYVSQDPPNIGQNLIVKGSPFDNTMSLAIISISTGVGGGRVYFSGSTNGSSNSLFGYLSPPGISINLNTWYHFAIVRYGTTWKGFWDGVQTFSFTSADALFSSSTPIQIRRTDSFLGSNVASPVYMDEVRIISGRAEYIDNFAPPVSQFPDNFNNPPPSISITTPISGDGAVSGDEEYLPLTISGSSSGADSRIVKVGVGQLTFWTTSAIGGIWSISVTPEQIQAIPAGTVQVTADVSDTVGKPAQQAKATFTLAKSTDQYFVNTSLILHMNGASDSTSFIDSSSNSFTVTRTGTVKISTAQSKFNGASALFDGSASWLSIADSAAFQFNTGDFTIEGWFNASAFSVLYPALIGNGNSSYSGSGNTGCAVISVVGSPRRVLFGTNTTNPIVIGTTTIVTGQWYHFAVTRSGTTVRLFVNGTLEATATNSQAINFSNNGLQIGRTGWDGANGYWNGYIDEIRITKGVARYTADFTVPSAAFANTQSGDEQYPKVSLLLHGDGADGFTTISDSSKNSLTVTRYGDTCIKTNQSKFDGSSIFFDGTADYLTVVPSSTHTYSGDFTLELWMYQSTYKDSVMVSSTNSNQNNIQIFRVNQDFNGSLSIYMDNNEASLGYLIKTTTQVFSINTWNHFAFTRSGNIGRLFVNGALVGVKNNWITGFRADVIGCLFTSGTRFTAVNIDYTGWIDEVRFTNGVSRYNSSFTVPSTRFYNP